MLQHYEMNAGQGSHTIVWVSPSFNILKNTSKGDVERSKVLNITTSSNPNSSPPDFAPLKHCHGLFAFFLNKHCHRHSPLPAKTLGHLRRRSDLVALL